MKKIFLSTLGTNDYIRCYYGELPKPYRFIQEALIDYIVQDCILDKVIIVVTNESQERNWITQNDKLDEEKVRYTGLKDILSQNDNINKHNIELKVEKIPGGKSEDEIWNIFDIISNKIDEDCELYLDITHGFRSIPFIMSAIVNYLRFAKNIHIGGIYYGAIEVLGLIAEIKKMPVDERKAAIFDMTPFVVIEQWSEAINDFIKYGRAETLKQIANESINPILRKTKGKDEVASKVKAFVGALNDYTKAVLSCRGPEIHELTKRLRNNFDELLEIEDLYIPQIKNLLKLLQERLPKYYDDEFLVGLQAVEWCNKHNLIQQGLTLLEEIIISKVNKIRIETDRKIAAQALNARASRIPHDKWIDPLKSYQYNREFVDEIPDIFVDAFNKLVQVRNNINHAGFGQTNKLSYEHFEKKLNELIKMF